MKININLSEIDTVEFGVGIDIKNDREYKLIPIDKSIQEALLDMSKETYAIWNKKDEVEE